MPANRKLLVSVAMLGLLAGCVEGAAPPSTAAIESTTTSTTTTTATTTPPTTLDPNAALEERCGGAEAPFTDSGSVGTGGRADSDATAIEAYTWGRVGPCEQVRLGFATAEGAPAVTPPEVEVRFLRWAGVVRLEFGAAVTAAVVAEQIVDTELIDRIYTVTEADGTMFVDVHLREPAFVRAFTSSGPAAIVVDIAPGGRRYPVPAVRLEDLVVIAPDPAATTYPLTVTGYTLLPGDTIEGVLRSPDGTTVVGGAVVGIHDFTWGGFAMVFPNGPPGDVSIRIGDAAPLDLIIP
jgi:hypothetical protein